MAKRRHLHHANHASNARGAFVGNSSSNSLALLCCSACVLLAFLLKIHLPLSRGIEVSHACSNRALDEWKSSVFGTVMTELKSMEVRNGVAGDPPWPSRFSSFQPFQTCSKGSVDKVGGDDDGMAYTSDSSRPRSTALLLYACPFLQVAS